MEQQPNELANHPVRLQDQYKNWYIDYASYVILERAVPAIEDGLKPVQRRILHAMKEMDDGRYNKVANIIGQSMQYHPHGDASIGEALITMGEKDLLIDTQGNWGDVRTGDEAAAARYIEARLSKFAHAICFNDKTTQWQLSYDGRKKEPITLPMKFPLLLAQGTFGIAVTLSTFILPHNFNELIEASILHLKNKSFTLYPDFITGGMIDVSNYQEGRRGGKIKIRATIKEIDKKTIAIRNVPYSINTRNLVDSITKANEQGKIKIKKVTDMTAQDVEIQIDIATGVSIDQTIDALYAFTDCQISISPNTCVIIDQKPVFCSVTDLLKHSVEQTKELLKKELTIQLHELEEKWHYTSLEKIFFEEKIYKELEKKHITWEHVLQAIAHAFIPFQPTLRRTIAREDIIKLTEKPVRRIYKLDIDELIKQINDLQKQMEEVKYNLEHLVAYTIQYFQELKQKFGKGRERKTEIKTFDNIDAKQVTLANTKMYIQREEGFIGTGLKKEEFVFDCSSLDDIIVITKRGIMKIVKVEEKYFIGKDIIHIAIFKKNDEKTIYHLIYVDGETGINYAKRFYISGITRDKEYNLTQEHEKSKVLYLSVNANGAKEIVRILLSQQCSAKNKDIDYDFNDLEIKNRGSLGNIVTKYPIKSIKLKEKGEATIESIALWYDANIGKLNTESKGICLGLFQPADQIILFYKKGFYKVIQADLQQRINNDELIFITKFDAEKTISLVYIDREKKQYMAKRFKIETSLLRTDFMCIKEGEENYIEVVSHQEYPILQIESRTSKEGIHKAKMKIANVIEITGWKSIGTRLFDYQKSIKLTFIDTTTETPPLVQGNLFNI